MRIPDETPETESPAYTVFVNSTDSFADTWKPFFDLLHAYWPAATDVVLNTETRTFSHSDVSVACTRVALPGEVEIPWGECMLRALDRIPTEYFVYLQDDYFLCESVRTDRIDEAVVIMAREALDCLRLMECGGAGPWEPTDYPWLWSLSRNAAYRISLQAGLWTKSGMRKYLRSHESPWQMEIWGSRRASRIPGEIWCVSREIYHETKPQITPYIPTGIVKGKWNRDAVETLFADHGIEVDFEERGWWDPASVRRSSPGTKLRKLPRYAWDRLRSL